MAEGGRAASQQEGPGLGIRICCVERWQGSTSADDSCELVKHLAPFPEQVAEYGAARHPKDLPGWAPQRSAASSPLTPLHRPPTPPVGPQGRPHRPSPGPVLQVGGRFLALTLMVAERA